MTEHLQHTSVESPHMAEIMEEAARDIITAALTQKDESHGAPTAWAIVMKHLIAQVADLTKKIEGTPASSSYSKPTRRDTYARQERPDKRRTCKNCLAAHPAVRAPHTMRECQRLGNPCNLHCPLCGLKHWETSCKSAPFGG